MLVSEQQDLSAITQAFKQGVGVLETAEAAGVQPENMAEIRRLSRFGVHGISVLERMMVEIDDNGPALDLVQHPMKPLDLTLAEEALRHPV